MRLYMAKAQRRALSVLVIFFMLSGLFYGVRMAEAVGYSTAVWPNAASNTVSVPVTGASSTSIGTTSSIVSGVSTQDVVITLTKAGNEKFSVSAATLSNWTFASDDSHFVTGYGSLSSYISVTKDTDTQATVHLLQPITGSYLIMTPSNTVLTGGGTSINSVYLFVSGSGVSTVLTSSTTKLITGQAGAQSMVISLTAGNTFVSQATATDPANWMVNTGATGMKLSSITYNSSTQVTMSFSPVSAASAAGTIGVTAKTDIITESGNSFKFTPYRTSGGLPLYAAGKNKNPGYVDITSGVYQGYGKTPSTLVASDGTNLFFRMLLRDNPIRRGSFTNADWLVLIGADVSGTYETVAVAGVDGRTGYVYVASAYGGAQTNIFPVASGTRVIRDAASGQFYLDFQVPIAALNSVTAAQAGHTTLTGASSVRFYFGTSMQYQNINKDFMYPGASSVSYAGLADVTLNTAAAGLRAITEKTRILATASSVGYGEVNPKVIVTLSGDTFAASLTPGVMTVGTGATGLTFASITRDSSTQATLSFTGTAAAGTLSISANAAAIAGGSASDNTLSVSVDGTSLTVSPVSFVQGSSAGLTVTGLKDVSGADILPDFTANSNLYTYTLSDFSGHDVTCTKSDGSAALTLPGQAALPAGDYYLTINRTGDGKEWVAKIANRSSAASITPSTASFDNSAAAASIQITALTDSASANVLAAITADNGTNFSYALTDGNSSVQVTKAAGSDTLVIPYPSQALNSGTYQLSVTGYTTVWTDWEISVTAGKATPPTSLSATAGSSAASLSWTAPVGQTVSYYRVYQSTASGSGYTLINGSVSGTTSASVTGLTAGTTYYYVVTAVISGTETLYSNETSVVPFTVPSVTVSAASSVSNTTATLNGNVTATGGSAITERGFVYSGADTTPQIGEAGVTKVVISGTTGAYSYSLSGLTPGTPYYVNAFATNAAGTVYGGSAQTVSTTSVAVPTVDSVAPATGLTTGGTNVVITGTGFTGVTAVKFGNADASAFHTDSSTQITATSPAGVAGVVDIIVTAAGGTSGTGVSDEFTFTLPPATASAASNSGSASPSTLAQGSSTTLTAQGDRQTAAGNITGDARFVPVTWSSDETGTPGGNFALNAGVYTDTYTPGNTGTFNVTLTFKKQTWDGSAWQDAGPTDTKTVSLTVNPPGTVSTANSASNGGAASPASLTAGGATTLTATGDRQSAAGAVTGDERFLPVDWSSSEGAGKTGNFTENAGVYSAVYATTAAGTYTVTLHFKKQTWDGTAWTDTVSTDTKTVTVTVTAVPVTAQGSGNSVSASPSSVTAGQSITVTATGDRQGAAAVVPGDERFVPDTWSSDEGAGTNGSFGFSGGVYSALYTTSAAGSYTVTAVFIKQSWNGSAWIDVAGAGGTDSKTVSVTVHTPGVPSQASAASNTVSASPSSLTTGSSLVLTAVGDRQSAAGTVALDERFVPVGWTSSEAGQNGSFSLSGGTYTSVYTPSAAGGYTVTATFKKQLWDGSAWNDAVGAGSTDSRTCTVIVSAAGGGGGSVSTQTPDENVEVLVNGKVEYAGTATKGMLGDKTMTTIDVDPKKLEQKLAEEGNNATVTIPVKSESDIVVGELNGQMVKNMDDKNAVLEVRTPTVSYKLPAKQMLIDTVSEKIGPDLQLQDIKVQISIEKSGPDTVGVVEDSARKGSFTVVAPPVEFTVQCVSGDKVISVSRFSVYVERTVLIPDGVDPSKITTGVVVEADGTVRHVPTYVTKNNNKYYAVINSLTNSSYSVVWHPLTFRDATGHWAEDAVNDMGSRMVIAGIGDGIFEPDRQITRAEFAAVIVKGLGLKPETGTVKFSDVPETSWYASYVRTASEYGLISGYPDGRFGPDAGITREEVTVILAKAMKITGLKAETGSVTVSQFSDAAMVSGWAEHSVSTCLTSGIITGKPGNAIAPQDASTRAEVALMIQRLLKKSGLI